MATHLAFVRRKIQRHYLDGFRRKREERLALELRVLLAAQHDRLENLLRAEAWSCIYPSEYVFYRDIYAYLRVEDRKFALCTAEHPVYVNKTSLLPYNVFAYDVFVETLPIIPRSKMAETDKPVDVGSAPIESTQKLSLMSRKVNGKRTRTRCS